ncbi:MAG TPA: cohesin domain-containing protein [Candidatus Saccharimonadia bacterium]|nr:cohesin domain-containing protein [Candidatus Saccharimonadia bacterium]
MPLRRRFVAYIGALAVFVAAGTLSLPGRSYAIVQQLYLTPAAASVQNGNNISIQIRVNSSADLVNAVQANFTYNPAQLQYVSVSAVGTAFDVDASSSIASGSIQLARGATTSVSGDNLFATITFKAIVGSGSASVNVASGSAVVRTSDASNILTQSGGAVFTLTPSPAILSTPLYRLYSRKSDRHFYTINPTERDQAIGVGYALEGVSFYVGIANGGNLTPIIRLYNRQTDYHFYTSSQAEANQDVGVGFVIEGTGYLASRGGDPGVSPVFRLLNKSNNMHFFTISTVERDQALATGGYIFEGTAFYAVTP